MLMETAKFFQNFLQKFIKKTYKQQKKAKSQLKRELLLKCRNDLFEKISMFKYLEKINKQCFENFKMMAEALRSYADYLEKAQDLIAINRSSINRSTFIELIRKSLVTFQ